MGDGTGDTTGATASDAVVGLAHDVVGEGALVVLVHGITESRRSWDPVVPLLAEHLRVLTVDLRGHGASPPGPAYGPLDYAGDVAAVVAELDDGTPPLVVGHSLGGIVATAYAGLAPCVGVVDVDQSLDLGAFQAQVLEAEPMLRSEHLPAVVVALFDSMRGSLSDDEHARLAGGRRADADVVLGTWAMLLERSPDEVAAEVEALTAACRVPFLALHGIDPGPQYPDWLARRIPGATVEVWDGAGHHPHLVDPERFVALVVAMAADVGVSPR